MTLYEIGEHCTMIAVILVAHKAIPHFEVLSERLLALLSNVMLAAMARLETRIVEWLSHRRSLTMPDLSGT